MKIDIDEFSEISSTDESVNEKTLEANEAEERLAKSSIES